MTRETLRILAARVKAYSGRFLPRPARRQGVSALAQVSGRRRPALQVLARDNSTSLAVGSEGERCQRAQSISHRQPDNPPVPKRRSLLVPNSESVFHLPPQPPLFTPVGCGRDLADLPLGDGVTVTHLSRQERCGFLGVGCQVPGL